MNNNILVFVGLLSAFCCSTLAMPQTGADEHFIVGAPGQINLDDKDLQEAAQFAVSSISAGSGSANKLGLLRIVSATHQVVSGSLYTIKLHVGRTDCTKADPKPACSVQTEYSGSDDPDFNECTVKVWDQSWLQPRYKITSLECSKPNTNATV